MLRLAADPRHSTPAGMWLLAFSLALATGAAAPAQVADHLLLCEAVVTPTSDEFVEIANPTASDVALDNYYLSDDEDYALLPGASGDGPAPSIASSDFIARFPAGAVIPAGTVLVVAFDGAGFAASFGFSADFEIGGTDPATPDMIATDVGSTAGLTNSGENAVLFYWDGSSDLVADVDMVNIGTPSIGNGIGDKTALAVDGPDAGTDASIYLNDAVTMPQQAADPGFGFSTKRIALEGAFEIGAAGNGITGDDETSEDISMTWDGSPGNAFTAPDPGFCLTYGPAAPQLVINEIMQDPAAVTDANGEWIELYNPNPQAVDIDGWTLSDDGSDSHTINNGGPLLVPAGGFLVLGINANAATNGGVTVGYQYSGLSLANGDDEVILTTGDGIEVDRVEYDGGPDFPDPTGASMTLAATSLDNNVGANWCEATSAFGAGDLGTPGAANDACPVPGADLVINEIDYDQPGTDMGEFIEIKNVGVDDADLGAFEIRTINGSGGGATIARTLALPSVSLPAGGYFVICADPSQVFPCDFDVSPNTDLIQNGAPDAVALATVAGGVIIDTVSYEGDTGAPYTEGSGAGLEDASGSTDDFRGISRFPDGIDTDQNNIDLSPRCITPGAENVAASSDCPDPRPPLLVINEIDYDQSGTDSAEFVEIHNRGETAADLGLARLDLINGNGAVAYESFALSGALPAGAYYVVCADAATVANCDQDVSPDANLIQNGDPDGAALYYDGIRVDVVSYEGDIPGFVEGSGGGLFDSAAPNIGISRLPNGADSNQNNVDFAQGCITPGFANSPLTDICTPDGPQLEIWEIQGASAATPYLGQGVFTPDNVVTAISSDGFFIRTPDARTDGDVDTSDGVFVFTAGPPGVAVGDVVDVSGEADEFFDFTEIGGFAIVTVDGSGPVPAPVVFDAAVPSPDPGAPSCGIELECYEGMNVSVADGSVVRSNQFFGSDPIAEVHVVARPGRSYREPGILDPGLPGLPVWDGNPEVFELDPDALGLPNEILPGGSTFSASGVIGFEFGGYELWPDSLSFTPPVPFPRPVRSRAPGELTVASLNMFRFFDDVDDPPNANADGQARDDGGAVSALEYADRRTKFRDYILDVLDAPDILGVQEVEKIEVLQDLAADIAAADPTVLYTAYLVEGNDIGTIDVAFLVRDTVQVDSVTQLGYTERLAFDDSLLHDRPPLLLEASYLTGNEPFPIQVMVVHNRSFGGIDSPSDGDRVRAKRLAQAQSIAMMVQAIQDADPGVLLTVIGDFNDYEFTDGYVDAVGQIVGDCGPALLPCVEIVEPDLFNEVLTLPAAERYSFAFAPFGVSNGQTAVQVLDHALTTTGFGLFVRGFEYGRGNADGAEIFDEDPSTPERSSDHDGFALFVMSDEDGDGVPDDLDVCSGTEAPESVPTVRLGNNRFALTDGDGTFDTGPRGSDVEFTTLDTAGCSCEQIIDELGLGVGQSRFGCSRSVMESWVEAVSP